MIFLNPRKLNRNAMAPIRSNCRVFSWFCVTPSIAIYIDVNIQINIESHTRKELFRCSIGITACDAPPTYTALIITNAKKAITADAMTDAISSCCVEYLLRASAKTAISKKQFMPAYKSARQIVQVMLDVPWVT